MLKRQLSTGIIGFCPALVFVVEDCERQSGVGEGC